MAEQKSALSTATAVLQQRRAGILLHPTSLPSGKLDGDVERWLELLADNGFRLWQVLPLCEPQSGLSPYQCSSTYAINPALAGDLPTYDETSSGYQAFCEEQVFWLDDYVLFKVLKQKFEQRAWYDWPLEYRNREAAVMAELAQQYVDEMAQLKWQQYQLFHRWQLIKKKATSLDILLFGDLPIFVGHDSADVWAHPEWFLLDESGHPVYVTGVPPDYFSETGQRWGNPHYNWETMQADDFVWWKSRIDYHLAQFDIIRIDHFRGLEAAWMIDADCETAVDGHWQKVPGDSLLASLLKKYRAELGTQATTPEEALEQIQLPFVAEDLGIITEEVTALRKKYHLPGMSILQFGFDAFDDNPHKVRNIDEDRVVYTGTHDNDTTVGWFNTLENDAKNNVMQTLALSDSGADITHEEAAVLVLNKMLVMAMQSKANTCIIPMQDYLQLDSDARMNIPGTVEGNWRWQFSWSQLEGDLAQQQKQFFDRLIRQSHRCR